MIKTKNHITRCIIAYANDCFHQQGRAANWTLTRGRTLGGSKPTAGAQQFQPAPGMAYFPARLSTRGFESASSSSIPPSTTSEFDAPAGGGSNDSGGSASHDVADTGPDTRALSRDSCVSQDTVDNSAETGGAMEVDDDNDSTRQHRKHNQPPSQTSTEPLPAPDSSIPTSTDRKSQESTAGISTTPALPSSSSREVPNVRAPEAESVLLAVAADGPSAAQTVPTLTRILSNILVNPDEPKYRQLRYVTLSQTS